MLKKIVSLLRKFQILISSRLFGLRQSSWCLGISTARDLLEFCVFWQTTLLVTAMIGVYWRAPYDCHVHTWHCTLSLHNSYNVMYMLSLYKSQQFQFIVPFFGFRYGTPHPTNLFINPRNREISSSRYS